MVGQKQVGSVSNVFERLERKTILDCRVRLKICLPLKPYAMESGQRVAIVFGVISPKISRRIVAVKVAIETPLEPKSERAIEVKIAERKIFTRSFEMRIVFISCSFLSKSLPARKALLSLFLRRILKRSLFIPKKALSEIEKSIERTIRENAIINKYEGISSKFIYP